jgi:hypothetical protein
LVKVILVSEQDPLKPVPSWRPGYFVWPGGRTKLVLLGGISTRSGDTDRTFSGLVNYLAQRGGYDPRRDVLEATYAGIEADGLWRPTPYVPADTRKPLIDIAEAVAGSLDWYRQRLPSETRLVFIGYSMGGVGGLDGATLAVARDRQAWRDRLGAVIALAAPVRGCSVGALLNWAWLVTAEADGLGAAGRDLDARWKDPDEQARLERRAVFLRSAGARVLTLVDPEDSVVRPEEGLVPAPGESPVELQIKTGIRRPGSLGHGAILDEPAVWRRILDVIGPQTDVPNAAARGAAGHPLDSELQALKERMRREGRIK